MKMVSNAELNEKHYEAAVTLRENSQYIHELHGSMNISFDHDECIVSEKERNIVNESLGVFFSRMYSMT